MAEGDHAEEVEHFKSVCAVDDIVARQFLERCDWVLEAAVQDYLNFQEGRPNAFGPEGEQNEQNRQNELRHRRPEGRAAGPSNVLIPPRASRSSAAVRRMGPPFQQRRPLTWMEWAWSLLLLPFHFTFQSLYEFYTFF
uniref:Uncharacterized protein n=1 Tax=Plectus sambesii TaxID=2011161 RepID=A0A914XJ92_9BILA